MRTLNVRAALIAACSALAVGPALAAEPPGDVRAVTDTPGLVAFWTFGEEAGQPRRSTGTQHPHPLTEVEGPIARVPGGCFSGYAAQFNGRQCFRIPHAELGDLNICGPRAEVSMFAVVRFAKGKTIAGIWSEGRGHGDDSGTRQYAMLLDMPTYGGPNKLTPHISAEGGVTYRADGTKFPWCADYAAGKTPLPRNQWVTLAFTYDGAWIKAYVNGQLDAQDFDAVAQKRTDPYFTQEGPGGGPRGINPYYHGRGIFCFDPARHAATKIPPSDFTVGSRQAVGKPMAEALEGHMAGLAVFRRALTDAEVDRLHRATGLPAADPR